MACCDPWRSRTEGGAIDEFSLAWLLRPLTVQAFLGEIWGAAHFHIKRSSEGYFGSLLPTASAVEELLDRVKPAASAVRLVRGGETKDPATYRLPGGVWTSLVSATALPTATPSSSTGSSSTCARSRRYRMP